MYVIYGIHENKQNTIIGNGQATSPCLNQWWSSLLPLLCVNRPRWVNTNVYQMENLRVHQYDKAELGFMKTRFDTSSCYYKNVEKRQLKWKHSNTNLN